MSSGFGVLWRQFSFYAVEGLFISHSFYFKGFGQKNGGVKAADQSAVFCIKGDYTATLQSR